MPKDPSSGPVAHPDDLADPGDLQADDGEVSQGGPGGDGPSRRGLSTRAKLAIAAGLVAVVAGGLLAYRSHQRARALAIGLPKAEALLRLDTAAGYRGAADLLVPLARIDPMEAGSMRAFALAMLASDYRDAEAEPRAEALLVEPGRAETVPAYANLAASALFLGRRAVADATTYAGRAGRSPWAGALLARIACLAGNLEAGMEPAASAAAEEPRLAGALAIQGDLLRRHRKDPLAARAAYSAALTASPLHPRAAYGLSKLALASQIPLADAIAPVQRVLGDAAGTPARERARAALHLAALQLRSGDRAAAAAALQAAPGLDGPARTWFERASTVMAGERRAYRAVLDGPPALQTPSDDDPPEVSPIPPPPPPEPPAAAPARKPVKKAPAPAKKAAPPAPTRKTAPKK